MYYARHTQIADQTLPFMSAEAVAESAEALGWEDSEWMLMEGSDFGNMRLTWEAEFPCTYTFRYGDEAYTCELTANRPDSLCPFHAGEEE